MVREQYLYNKVLKLYEMLDKIVFPMEPKLLFNKLKNCQIMSYQEFAEIGNHSVEEVINFCKSKSGCTHYDVANNRYLVLINESTADNNVVGRIRWSSGHELGHVSTDHLQKIFEAQIAENNFNSLVHPELEKEADFFASVLLSPMPLYERFNIKSPFDVARVFGLSGTASENRWNAYLHWRGNHYKTAWENDIRRLYDERS